MTLDKAKEAVDGAFTATDRRGLAYENAFGGATSFLRRMYTKDLTGFDLAVTGVPFDQAVANVYRPPRSVAHQRVVSHGHDGHSLPVQVRE